MKRRWRQFTIAVLCLILTLALGACGSSGSKTKEGDKVLFSYDGKDATLKEYWIYVKMLAANYEQTYSSYFGENFWTMSVGTDDDGNAMTFEDSIKQQAVSQMKQVIVLNNKAEELKCSLSEEDKKNCEKYAKAFAEQDKGKEILKECGGKVEDVQKIYEVNALASKVQKEMVKDTDTNVSDKEARTTKVSRIVSETTKTDDQGQSQEMTKEEKAEVLKKAEAALAKINQGTTLEDAAKAEEYTNVTETFKKGESEEGKAFEKAVEEMKDGALYPKVMECDNGYVVFRLDAFTDKAATEETKKGIIAERQQKVFQETYDGWTKDLEKDWDFKKNVDQDLFAQVVLHSEESTEAESTTQTAPADAAGASSEAATEAATQAQEATTAAK